MIRSRTRHKPGPKERGSRYRIRRLVIRLLAAFSLFLVILLFAALTLLTVGPGERYLKGMAEKQLSKALRQNVRIGELETNLLSRLQIRDVRVWQTPSEGEEQVLLSLASARADYRITDLLRRRLSLRTLELDGLNVAVYRDSSGVINILQPEPSAEPEPDTETLGSSVKMILGRLMIQNSSFRYHDARVPIEGRLENLRGAIELGDQGAYRYHLAVDSVFTLYRDISIALHRWRVNGSWQPQLWMVDSLSVNLPDLALTGRAEVRPGDEEPCIVGTVWVSGDPGALWQRMTPLFDGRLPDVNGRLDLTAAFEGTIAQPRVQARLEVTDFQAVSVHLPEGALAATWESGMATLEDLQLRTLGGRLAGRGRYIADSLGTFDLALDIRDIDIAQTWRVLYQEASPYRGAIGGDIALAGAGRRPEEWTASANVRLRQVQYRSERIPDYAARLSYENKTARLFLDHQDSRVSARARLSEDRLEGNFSMDVADLEPLAGLANIQELTGTLQILGDLSGSISSPAVTMDVTGRNISYQNFPVDTLSGRIAYRDGQVSGSEIVCRGALTVIDTLRAPFHLKGFRGSVSYRIDAHGSFDEPAASLNVNLNEFGYGDQRIDQGRLQIALTDRRAELKDLRLRRDSLLVTAAGQADIDTRRGTCRLDLFEIPSPRDTLAPGPPPSDRKPAENGGTPAPLGGITAAFDLSRLEAPALQVSGELDDLGPLARGLPGPAAVRGSLIFEARAQGTTENPSAELTCRGYGLGQGSVEIDSMRAHLLLADHLLELTVLDIFEQDHHSLASASLALTETDPGRYTLSNRSAFHGRVQGQRLDLAMVREFLPLEMEMAGRCAYDVSWEGTLNDPRPFGTIEVREGAFQVNPSAPPIEQIDLSFSLQDSVLTVDRLTASFHQMPLSLLGQITVSQLRDVQVQLDLAVADFGTVAGRGTISPDSLEMTAHIHQMDLSLVQPFFVRLEKLSGTLNTEVLLSGSPQDPQMKGHLTIHRLVLQPRDLDTPLTGGVVTARFDRDTVVIDSLFMCYGNGTIFLSGRAAHSFGELTDANLQTRVRDIHIRRPEEVNARIRSVDLIYRRTNGHYLLHGDVVLGETRMLVDFKPQSISPFAQRVERPKKELPAILGQTRLDVRLHESENIWVDNNLARLRLHAELGVIGTAAQPNLSGRLAVEEGYILYLDRKFKMQRGTVDFADPQRLNPIIDFSTESSVSSYQEGEWQAYSIVLSVQGPLDEARVSLTSEPPLDKPDIVSLLTLGRTRGQLSSGRDGSSALVERAKDLSSKRITGYTERKLGRLLGLEQITIEGNLFQFDKSWGPRLVASKKISKRMDVTYTTTVGYLNDYNIQLGYRLTPHFSLVSQTDQRGRSGIDLLYKLRFR
jgi:autotransporter translocation and assembly factor TamB